MADVEMSSEELRTQLYTSLRGKGILDSLKSQLRTKLAVELQNSFGAVSPRPSTGRSSDRKSPKATEKPHHCAMSIQVANSIIAEHMKKAGFEYSLSVFLPEAGLNMDKLFKTEDLLHFLRISPSSLLAKSLQTTPSEHGFLVQLLEALSQESVAAPASVTSPQPKPKELDESATAQSELCALDGSTSQAGFRQPTVATQLQALENAYARKAEEESQRYQKSLDDRLSEYQRDLEARYKKQLETEMSLFRTKELVKVRLEEREKHQAEVLREREEAHAKHQQRLDELRKSELQMKERYCKKEQELEASIYSQRQSLLSEMNSLKVREAEMRRQAELDKQMMAMEKERVKMKEEQLTARETALKQQASEKAQKYQLELESQLRLKERELLKWESEYHMDKGKLASTRSDQQVVATELLEERKKGEQIQQLLQETTDRQIVLEGQKEALQQQLDQMKDYQHLKQKLSELQQYVAVADKKLSETKIEYKRRLSEQKQLVKQLQTRNSRPIAELNSLQEQLEQLRKQHHSEMLVMEYDNKNLGKQLAVQTEYSIQLQRQLDEQLIQLKSAQREVEDLHSLVEQLKPLPLRQTVRVASPMGKKGVNGNVKRSSQSLRKPVSSFSRRLVEPSSLHLHHQPLSSTLASFTATAYPRSTSDDAAALLALGLPTTTASVGVGTYPRQQQGPHFSDAPGQFLADTKATFARLEKEAKELEKTYQSFHRKAGVESPPLYHDDEPFSLLHHTAEHDTSISSHTSTPDIQLSSALHTLSSTKPKGAFHHHTSSSQPVPALSSVTTTTYSTAVVTSTDATSSTHPSVQGRATTTVTATGTLQPSTLTTVVAAAPPPILTATIAATSPPPITSSSPSHLKKIETKPLQSVDLQEKDKVSLEETLVSTRQRLSLDDWWKSSASAAVPSKTQHVTTVTPPQSMTGVNPTISVTTVTAPKPTNGIISQPSVTAVTHPSAVFPPPLAAEVAPALPSLKPASTVDTKDRDSSPHFTDKPKIKLDDLWKSSSSAVEKRGVMDGESNKSMKASASGGPQSQSPLPPVRSPQTSKISLDDLWKSPSRSKPQPGTTLDTNKQLREERKDNQDKLGRLQTEQPQQVQVRKELEDLRRQDEHGKIEASNQQKLDKHKTEAIVERTSLEVASGIGEREVSEERKPVTSDNEGIDPVMLKYMELVKEKRQKEQKPDKSGSHFPPARVGKDSSHSERDYGVPSLSQATDSFGGFSDNENEGDPFEDW